MSALPHQKGLFMGKCCRLLPLIICLLSSNATAQNLCSLNEDGYAVLAAVLFPNDPEIPDQIQGDLERKAYMSLKTVRLEGFHGSSYVIREETMIAGLTKGPDQYLMEDFSRRNKSACRLDPAILRASVPKGVHVQFIGTSNASGNLTSPKVDAAGPLADKGFATLSLPGFSRKGDTAVLEVDYKAGAEMGVGYRVFLEKSRKSGKWIITGTDQTRIY
jgi:hypothetical protein